MEVKKLSTLDEDLAIIQKLENEPNDVGGMSAEELKKAFDQGGITIQKFINEVLIPELENSGALESVLRRSENIKYLRLREDRVIEASEDGETWEPTLGPDGTTFVPHRERHAKSGSDPINPADIGAAVTVTYTVQVPTDWRKDGDYFVQDVSVPGVLRDDNPTVDVLTGNDNDANLLYEEAFGKVFRVVTYDDSIQVWAREAETTAFPIQMKVVR